MPDYTAGEASLKIVPDAREFLRKLEADLAQRRAEFSVDVTADLTRATEEIDRFRLEQQRNAVNLRVRVDSPAARADVQRAATDLGDLFSKSFGGLTSPGALGIGAGLLPALASGVADVAASVQQLAQAGLALPGIFASIGADVATVKLATSGVADAFDAVEKASDGSATNIQAANAALANLAPQAADFVRRVSGLKPAFDDLRETVQGNFFDGLGKSVQDLANNDLPVLKSGLGDIATSFNENLKQVGASLGSDSSKGILDRILGNTADAQGRLTAAIDPLIAGLGTLAGAGTDVLPRLSDDLVRLSERFANFITDADQSGALTQWINEGINGFEHLGSTLGNIGSAFVSITGQVQGDLLKSLDDATGEFADFLNSPEGEQQLKDFLREGNEQLKLLGETASNLGPTLKTAFGGAVENTHELLVALQGITGAVKFLQDNVPGLGQSFQQALNPLKTFTDIFGQLTDASPAEVAQQKLDDAKFRANAERDGGLPIAPGTPGGSPVLPGFVGPTTTGASPLPVPNPTLNPFLVPKKATGGSISGPGQQGKDSVPILAAPGEHMLTADDVDRMGGQAAVYAFRRALRGYEGGGQILPGSPRDVDGTGDTLKQMMMFYAIKSGLPPVTSGGGNFNPGMKIDTSTASFAPPFEQWRLTMGDINDITVLDAVEREKLFRPTNNRVRPGQDATYDWLHNRRGYATGGEVVDQFGNPVTAGPVAPNPATGGISSIANSFLSGIGGPIGNVLGPIGGGTAGSSNGVKASLTPGFAGLAQAGSNPDLLNQWGTQTGDWLGNFAAKTLTSFGTTLYQGALGFFGLENSILSPNNTYNQAAQKTAAFFLGQDGPFGQGAASADGVPDLAAITRGGGTSESGIKIGTGAGAGLAINGKGGGAERWRPVVQKALAEVGGRYGITNIPAWTNALIGQIQFESGGNPAALNPNDSDGLPAIGLGQFKRGTFDAHNITGGSINDGTAQVYAMIDYVATRYGQTANGVPKGINQGRGYRYGGPTPPTSGPLPDGGFPAVVHPGEYMISARGRATVPDSFLHALNAGQLRGLAGGGDVLRSLPIPPPPRPNFDIPVAETMKPRPTAPTAPSGSLPSPPPPLPSIPEQPAPTAPIAAPPPQQTTGSGPAPVATAPSSYDHNLPAVNTAIASGAATLGSIAQTAASVGTFGAAGGLGGGLGGALGGGGGGPSIQGLFQQGGKIVSNLVNVGSSFLVGNVTGGTEASQYGTTNVAAPRTPQTAPLDGSRQYIFNGIDSRNVVDELRLKDSQEQQATLAQWR